mgnify:FL=1
MVELWGVSVRSVGSHGFCIPWKEFYIGWCITEGPYCVSNTPYCDLLKLDLLEYMQWVIAKREGKKGAGLVIDVGANIGNHAVFIGSNC